MEGDDRGMSLLRGPVLKTTVIVCALLFSGQVAYAQCAPDEIPDCNGNCAPIAWIGDGVCDNGKYEWNGVAVYFDCDEFDCDGGDCDPENSPNCTGIETMVWYVDQDVPPGGDGSSWTWAFQNLEQALLVAEDGEQIWVAEGTYRPSGANKDSRSATFSVEKKVGIYGGFVGTETSVEQADPLTNMTVLSGDLNGDDPVDFSDNAYSVVTFSTNGVGEGTLLHGFVITAGNADYEDDANPAQYTGGGILFDGTTNGLLVERCEIRGNQAISGGGVANTDSFDRGTFMSCRFNRNTAHSMGGGIYATGSITVINSQMAGNSSDWIGGAVAIDGGSLTMTNCTIATNIAWHSGGLHGSDTSTADVTNCIIWDNTDFYGEGSQIEMGSGALTLNYSCIMHLEAGWGGTGNIAKPPRFDDERGTDDLPGTGDEALWLMPTSPCIDAGDTTTAIVDVLPSSDLGGELLRRIDDPYSPDTGPVDDGGAVVDMGAWERAPTTPATGGIFVWSGGNGVFNDATNWIPVGIPGPGDTAMFEINDATGTVIITLPEDVANRRVVCSGGGVSLDITGQQLAVDGSDPVSIAPFGDRSAELIVLGSGGYLDVPGFEVDADGILTLREGVLVFAGTTRIRDGGRFGGDGGMVSDVWLDGGIVGPDGQLSISGDIYGWGSSNAGSGSMGSMVFDIAGYAPGTGYDQLQVSGTAHLGGALVVKFDSDFAVQIGDTFDVLSSGAIDGEFDGIICRGLPPGMNCRWLGSSGLRGGGVGVGEAEEIVFGEARTTALSGDPGAIAIADLNGDSDLDVAVAIPANGTVEVLLNDGGGPGSWAGFSSDGTVVVGANPVDLRAADLDGDSDVDLVVANYDDDTVSVLVNDGSASFSVFDFAVDENPVSVAVGDFVEGGNGFDDLAVACEEPSATPVATILQNTTTFGIRGTAFTEVGTIAISMPTAIDPADVDTNKDLDYVVLSESGDSLLVKNGDGAGGTVSLLSTPIDLGAGSAPVAQLLGDVNGDGADDVLTANFGTDEVSILRSWGTSLYSPVDYPLGSAPQSLALADFDNDGDLDLAVSAIGTSDREIVIARNDTEDANTIVFSDIGSPVNSGTEPTLLVTGDVDGDGLDDLVSITQVDVLARGVQSALTVNINGEVACAEDVNGDGAVDVSDLLLVIGAWGASGGAEDIDGSGTVDVSDLLMLIAAWGSC
jgi:predicted outer membrane repeat protein